MNVSCVLVFVTYLDKKRGGEGGGQHTSLYMALQAAATSSSWQKSVHLYFETVQKFCSDEDSWRGKKGRG